jgi:hypothetical protein
MLATTDFFPQFTGLKSAVGKNYELQDNPKIYSIFMYQNKSVNHVKTSVNIDNIGPRNIIIKIKKKQIEHYFSCR